MDELSPAERALLAAYREELEPPAGADARVREALRRRVVEDARARVVPLPTRRRLAPVLGVMLSTAAALALVSGYLISRTVERRGAPVEPQAPFQSEGKQLRQERAIDADADRGASAESPAPRPVVEASPAAETVAPAAMDEEAPREARPAPPTRSARTDPRDEAPTRDEAPVLEFTRELQLIRAAEALVKEGRTDAALAVLDRHEREFPEGQLIPERVASRVSALCQRGEATKARALAQRFLREYPGSHLEGRVRGACEP
ncbi:MAG: hypothetical protein KC636_22660 [Myxococcales bacterium]|nr:hypothetical protein [Myxococcales bacterium]